eukprot:TRINITY_DN5679_c1_g3_i2.p1 TRINITY_DN5679_c1_g3~~TRINITY_DN5679_c1_g3_i2.p1  ORF type:complete len:496 (-),score=95.37 TRINITY_DN5679_c1_g3_i2:76-1452(-)
MLIAVTAPLGLFSLLLIPQVEDVVFDATNQHLTGTPFGIATSVLMMRHFTFCLGDYLGCVKNEFSDDAARAYGWKSGVAPIAMFSLGIPEGPLYYSHAAYKAVANDPKAGRPADVMVLSNKSALPFGVLPDSEPVILLNFDTGHPEHFARRSLLADALPALMQKPPVDPELAIPKGVKPSDAAVFGHPLGGLRYLSLKRIVFDVVGLNIFKNLFDVDISEDLAGHFEYDSIFAPGVLGMPVTKGSGARLSEIRTSILKKVAASARGKEFVALAQSRDMDGSKRLDEMVWIAMFAGYGGTSNLAFETIKHVLKKPAEYAALFRKDPEAFMLEAARLYPPVGGMNPMKVTKAAKYSFQNGRPDMEVKPGDLGVIFTSNANRDPTIFKDPEEFRPGRENADRLLSWNAEIRDFSTCDSVAGCPAAPRGCPGTFLSLRIATKTVAYFVGGIEEALGAEKKEL